MSSFFFGYRHERLNIGVSGRMTDLQSAAKAPLIQAPIAWVARKLLSSDPSVQVVMIMGDDGKILAHERSLEYSEGTSVDGEYSLTYYAPSLGLLFYVRANGTPVSGKISSRIETIVNSPAPYVTE